MEDNMEQAHNDVKMRILMAAKKLFAEKGYDGTTVREICEEAESNIALVSYYFGGKENVFFTLFDMFSPRKRIKLDEPMDDPVKGISYIIGTMIDYVYEEPLMISIVQQELFLNGPRMNRISEYTSPVWLKLRELLEDGREKGLFEFRSLDRAMIMIIAAIICPMKNPNMINVCKETDMLAEEIKQDTLDFVLYGLRYRKND